MNATCNDANFMYAHPIGLLKILTCLICLLICWYSTGSIYIHDIDNPFSFYPHSYRSLHLFCCYLENQQNLCYLNLLILSVLSVSYSIMIQSHLSYHLILFNQWICHHFWLACSAGILISSFLYTKYFWYLCYFLLHFSNLCVLSVSKFNFLAHSWVFQVK